VWQKLETKVFHFQHGLYVRCLWLCLLHSFYVLLSIFVKDICYNCQTTDCLFDLAGTSCIVEAIWKVIDIYSPATTVMEMVTAVKRNIWKCVNKRRFWREKFNQETHYRHLHFSSTAQLVYLNGRMFSKCLAQITSAWLYFCIHLLTWIIKWCSFTISQEANKLC